MIVAFWGPLIALEAWHAADGGIGLFSVPSVGVESVCFDRGVPVAVGCEVHAVKSAIALKSPCFPSWGWVAVSVDAHDLLCCFLCLLSCPQ